MRPLRHSINVTLDECRDHRAMIADEDLRSKAVSSRRVNGLPRRGVNAAIIRGCSWTLTGPELRRLGLLRFRTAAAPLSGIL
jgi:hypothetical protein